MYTMSANKDKEKAYKTNRYRKFIVACVTLFYLSACGGGGGSDSASPPPPPLNQNPSAVITVNQSIGTVPLTVEFSGANSTDSDGSIASYSWDFTSDGSADASLASSSFTYETVGDYTATLTVTDDDGATDTTTVEINVEREIEKILFRSRDSDNSNGLSELYTANDDGTGLTLLASPGANKDIFSPKFSSDGQWVAYLVTGPVNTVSDLFVVSIEGGTPLRLNQSLFDNMQNEQQFVSSDFHWSPDSSQIVYTINSGTTATGGSAREVWLVNRDGSERTKISGSLGSPARVEVIFPYWSADGQTIFQHVQDLDTGNIFAINIFDTSLGTANSTRLFTTSDSLYIAGYPGNPGNQTSRYCYGTLSSTNAAELRVSDGQVPAQNSTLLGTGIRNLCQWSHDDLRVLAITYDGAQFLLQGFDPENLESPITFAINQLMGSEQWRPGSNSEISYREINTSSNKATLFYATADGTTVDVGVASDTPNSTIPSRYKWSPDGARIAYTRVFDNGITTPDNEGLYTVDPDGTNTIEIINTEDVADFSWSQDNMRLAFSIIDTSDINNFIPKLFFINSDGTESIELNIDGILGLSDITFQPKP